MEPENKYVQAKEIVASRGGAKSTHHNANPNNRIPPGQHTVAKMIAMPPIIHDYPRLSKNQWKLRIHGDVENEITIDWNIFNQLPHQEYTIDFHCVTTWSKLDQQFTGVPFSEIIKLVKPKENVEHVIFECADGYTTNVVYRELLDNPAFIADLMDGHEIEPKYGGPVRGVIPHLYGWKSAKHLIGIRFQEEDEPGFWEVRGYHNHADPWTEERYG